MSRKTCKSEGFWASKRAIFDVMQPKFDPSTAGLLQLLQRSAAEVFPLVDRREYRGYRPRDAWFTWRFMGVHGFSWLLMVFCKVFSSCGRPVCGADHGPHEPAQRGR